MKNKIISYSTAALAAFMVVGCSKNPEVYSYPDNGLNFKDTVENFSFIYGPQEVTQDTVWVKVFTMGFLSDRDRELALEQEQADGNNAVAGTHYLAFDNEALRKYYFIPGGKAETRIPVIVFRDRSLENQDYTLLVRVRDNGNFVTGRVENSFIRITISDRLARPRYWHEDAAKYFLGEYGREKHRFLIEQTGERWDDDYFYDVLGYTDITPTNTFGRNSNYDGGYITYLNGVLKRKLEEVNRERLANGLDVLKEEDKTIVTFP